MFPQETITEQFSLYFHEDNLSKSFWGEKDIKIKQEQNKDKK